MDEVMTHLSYRSFERFFMQQPPNQQWPSQAGPPYQPLPHQRFAQWYNRQWHKNKFATGSLTLIVVLLLCSACVSSVNAGKDQSANANQTTPIRATATPATRPAVTPTATPTATPRPVPPTPTPIPVQQAQPTQAPMHTGVNGNPWGYDFNPGGYITNPPSAFCSYFSCITSFWSGTGYVTECTDGMYSKSGGHTGSCSKHGGDLRPLYSH
jgi:hypothetical protein